MPQKAPIATPRRAIGDLLGHGVRFGSAAPDMIVGEGLETMLSLRMALTATPMVATLSSAHLAAFAFPACLRRLYVARDRDSAGDQAVSTLGERTDPVGIEMIVLDPVFDDFNTDLMRQGLGAFAASLAHQLPVDDQQRLVAPTG
jgi:hypothetical protein